MTDEITSFREYKIIAFEMIGMKGSTNQIDRTYQVLLDCGVLQIM